MSIELPPLYGTAHGYACEVVQARERILTERIAELEAACIAAEAALTGLDFDYDGTKDACDKVTRALRGKV